MLLGPKLTDWIDETPLSLFVLCKKKEKKKVRAHFCFLFSVQLIAAVYPFMSNHRCMYPHIPMPGSSSEPVAVCFTTALSLCLSLPGIFSQFKLISRCALLYKKTPLSLFLSHSLSSCVRCIHPSLSHSLYLSASVSLLLSLSFPLSVRLTKKHLLCMGWCPLLATCPTFCFCAFFNCFALRLTSPTVFS